MDPIYLIWFSALGLGMAAICLFNWLQNRGPTLCGPATLLSRRVEHSRSSGGGYRSNNWNYSLIFALSDGEKLELTVFEQQFHQWQDGSKGTLYWRRDNLVDFIPEED